MDEEEQNYLLDRLAAAMLSSPIKRAKEQRVEAAVRGRGPPAAPCGALQPAAHGESV